jgi:Alr-MurF fusion protein
MSFPTVYELADIVGGTLLGAPVHEGPIRRVSVDSRRCYGGEAFFALKGRHTNGNAHMGDALRAGAAVAIVDRPTHSQAMGAVIRVESSLRALQKFAAWYRKRHLNRVLAITGSNGKTIVKDALTTLCAGRFSVASSPGSYNSQLGVALSLLSIPAGTDVAIIEVGISAVGEMDVQRLVVQPDLGILTNVGLAHIGNFGTREQTASEKLKLFQDLGPESWLMIPDDALVQQVLKSTRLKTVVSGDSTSGLPELVQFVPGALIALRFGGEREYTIPVQTRSRHLVEDLVIAAGAAALLGVEEADLVAALESVSFAPTRLEFWRTPQGVNLINDACSADPLSVQAALATLQEAAQPGGRSIFVFGGMRELGEHEAAEHGFIGTLAGKQGVSLLVIPTDGPANDTAEAFLEANPNGQVTRVEENQSVSEVVRDLARSGDTLLFKGPSGHELGREARLIWEAMAPKRLVVDLGAIRENILCFRRLGGAQVKLLAMLKAWAYGTELGRIGRWLQQCGVDWIGVSAADEGALARRAGVHLPILVTLLDLDEVDKIVRYRLTPVVYSLALAEALIEVADRLKTSIDVHLKVDTGMGRLGVRLEELPELIQLIDEAKFVRTTGLMTHLSCADDASADDFTRSQLARFEEAVTVARSLGLDELICHASATSGVARFPEAHYDMVRVGLGLYGIYPSYDVAKSVELQLALGLVSRIAHIATRSPGESIGYGATFVVQEEGQRIGVVEIGYNDGVPWRLSNRGTVLIHGRRAKIVGRVSMDSLMVDLSNHPEATAGTEVLLFGSHEGQILRPEEVANVAGTIPYELLVKVDSRRVQRLFVGE